MYMKSLMLGLLVVLLCAGCGQRQAATSNSIVVIVPYRYANTWVFDDERRGLVREAFVAGTPELIDKLVTNIPNADKGFRLFFSATPFPGATHTLSWRRGDANGNWYYSEEFKAECWLCLGLFKFYQSAPKELHVKAESKQE
jgi:hypothetical protein